MKRDLKKIISEMTLEEKAGLCSGKDFLEHERNRAVGSSVFDDV